MFRPARLTVVLLAIAWPASARQLPIKVYTTADGLPRNRVGCIVEDSRGFLWFCTSSGLARFDGYRFTNYGTEHGLPDRSITALLQTRDGSYWAGTTDGIYVLRSRPGAS